MLRGALLLALLALAGGEAAAGQEATPLIRQEPPKGRAVVAVAADAATSLLSDEDDRPGHHHKQHVSRHRHGQEDDTAEQKDEKHEKHEKIHDKYDRHQHKHHKHKKEIKEEEYEGDADAKQGMISGDITTGHDNPLENVKLPKECPTTPMAEMDATMNVMYKLRDDKNAKLRPISCPLAKSSQFDQDVSGFASKYSKRAFAGSCDSKNGMWQWDKEHVAGVTMCKYSTIAQLFRLQEGQQVLDWGAGCGHQLDLLAKNRGFFAVGMDIIQENVLYAKKYMKNLGEFCLSDGDDLSYIGDNVIDFVMSNAALYHLPRARQCHAVRDHVFRVLKVGGCAWFGWLGTEHAKDEEVVPQEFWTGDCFQGYSGAKVITIAEKKLFGTTEYDIYGGTEYSLFVCKEKEELVAPDKSLFQKLGMVVHWLADRISALR